MHIYLPCTPFHAPHCRYYTAVVWSVCLLSHAPPTATVSIEETGRETLADMECARNPRPGAGFFSEKENINGFSLSIRNVFINFVAG